MSDIYILGECYRKTQTHSIYLPWLGLEKKPNTTTKTALRSSKEGARCHTPNWI